MLEQIFVEIDNLLKEENIEEACEMMKFISSYHLTDQQQYLYSRYKEKINNLKKETLLKVDNNKKTNDENFNNKIKNRLSILQDARNKLFECEKIGENTLEHLDSQREQIKNMNDKTANVNSNMSVSSKLTSKMNSWWR
jgi:hypothetical protein